ncbi:MAG: PilT/PilU family type 4a pilus ATPase [Nitrospinota bacterium]|nr:PilT/PilU family type 4a pilus ATPase [Nitrospinota bacterium]
MQSKDLDFILNTMLDSHPNVSDLNFTVGKPLQVEASGILREVAIKPALGRLTPFQTENIAFTIINSDPRLTRQLLEQGSADCSYSLGDRARFRVNIFSQRATYSLVLRKLESRIPTIADMSLPKVMLKIIEEKNGMVLVTGATGSGKTTSLAAMLDEINRKKPIHVVTLEDPVEFSHPHKMATFNQREMGQDFDTFSSGLRAALRQAPKVILVGEMRDRDTMEIGMTAAETGHLLMSTLHTVDAGSTINRIVGMFDQEEEQLIRIRLADTFRWVVCQRLLPKKGGGRVAAFEIMGMNLRVKDAILNGEEEGKTFYDIITAAEPFGWRTFDAHMAELYATDLITEETAVAYASRKSEVQRKIDKIKQTRGEKTSDIDGLDMDSDYSKGVDGAPKRKRR